MDTNPYGIEIPEPVIYANWHHEHGWTAHWWDFRADFMEQEPPTATKGVGELGQVAAFAMANMGRCVGHYENSVEQAEQLERERNPELF